MKTREVELKFDIDVLPEPQKGAERMVRMNVKGMMLMIKRCMPDKNKQDLLDEYVKFALMDMAGITEYPSRK